MLQLASPVIVPYITHLINMCIEDNTYPELWKNAIGIPLPKVNKPNSMTDLRLISILPTISKILEKVLYKQLYQYFTINNIIPECQAGFRKNFSTGNALAKVMDEIVTALDKRLVTVLVLLDYFKAFDKINHKLLCSKLKYFGLSSSAVLILESFLSGRHQCVKMGDYVSNFKSISAGVPQGSILGPLLFLIYTSDLLVSTNYCSIQAYADDTQLSYSFPYSDIVDAQKRVNSDINLLASLGEQHNLCINSAKSKVLIFANRKDYNNVSNFISIHANNQTIPIVNSARNLGIVIDRNLNFEEHVSNLISRAYYALRILYSSKQFLTWKIKKMLVESLVLSLFNYCNFIYWPFLDNNRKNRIQLIQNYCCRFIYGLKKYDHISLKIEELGWLKMETRVKIHFACFLFKNIHQLPRSNLLKKLTHRSCFHNYNTRYKHHFNLPKFSTNIFKKGFTYMAIKATNSSNLFWSPRTVQSFKFAYRKTVIEGQ